MRPYVLAVGPPAEVREIESEAPSLEGALDPLAGLASRLARGSARRHCRPPRTDA